MRNTVCSGEQSSQKCLRFYASLMQHFTASLAPAIIARGQNKKTPEISQPVFHQSQTLFSLTPQAFPCSLPMSVCLCARPYAGMFLKNILIRIFQYLKADRHFALKNSQSLLKGKRLFFPRSFSNRMMPATGRSRISMAKSILRGS